MASRVEVTGRRFKRYEKNNVSHNWVGPCLHRTIDRLQQRPIIHATGDDARDQRAGTLKDGSNLLKCRVRQSGIVSFFALGIWSNGVKLKS